VKEENTLLRQHANVDTLKLVDEMRAGRTGATPVALTPQMSVVETQNGQHTTQSSAQPSAAPLNSDREVRQRSVTLDAVTQYSNDSVNPSQQK
jgi:hypothetical protein